jgi:hypothetical protein
MKPRFFVGMPRVRVDRSVSGQSNGRQVWFESGPHPEGSAARELLIDLAGDVAL